ncbi:MAG: efflux RND transporter periplasmic adaptor subunit [Syntrophomonas sp.]
MAEVDTELMSAAVMKKKLPKPVKITLIIIILLAAGIGGYYTYKSSNKQDTTYLTMPATKETIVDQIEATGTIKPLHEIDLYFRQQGTLKALYARSGDSVEESQVLALQDDTTLQAEVEQCQSDLQQAQLKLQQSQNDYDKSKTAADRENALYQAGAVAQSDWEQTKRDLSSAEINLKLAEVAISTAQAKLVIAQTNLDNAQLTAPFSGIAAEVNGEVGQETGNSSTALFHLISNDLQVQAMVNEVDIGRVKVGQEVNFTVTAYNDKTFKGTVSRISPQATATNNVQQYEVDIATSGLTSQLKAGMSVTAKIIVNKRENVIAAPNLALTYAQTYARNNRPSAAQSPTRTGTRSTGSQQERLQGAQSTAAASNTETKQIVILKNGKPVIKQITVGLSDGTNTEVKTGLSAGDKVIIGTNDATQNNSSGNSGSGNSSSGNSSKRSGGMMGGPMP